MKHLNRNILILITLTFLISAGCSLLPQSTETPAKLTGQNAKLEAKTAELAEQARQHAERAAALEVRERELSKKAEHAVVAEAHRKKVADQLVGDIALFRLGIGGRSARLGDQLVEHGSRHLFHRNGAFGQNRHARRRNLGKAAGHRIGLGALGADGPQDAGLPRR